MTILLEQAFAKAAEQTPAEQNALATLVLDEIADEQVGKPHSPNRKTYWRDSPTKHWQNSPQEKRTEYDNQFDQM